MYIRNRWYCERLLFSISKIFIELWLCRENCMKIYCGQNARVIITGLSSDGDNLLKNWKHNSFSFFYGLFFLFRMAFYKLPFIHSQTFIQFSSVAQLCPTLCDPMNRSRPGLPVHHQLLEFTQTHVHRVSDAIQPSHPLSSPFPPALNLSQHQGLFQWVSSSHQVAKVLKFQLQHQSFQWTPRADLL